MNGIWLGNYDFKDKDSRWPMLFLSGGNYASRHFQKACQSQDSYWQTVGHIALAFFEAIPVLGGAIALGEYYLHKHCEEKQTKKIEPIPITPISLLDSWEEELEKQNLPYSNTPDGYSIYSHSPLPKLIEILVILEQNPPQEDTMESEKNLKYNTFYESILIECLTKMNPTNSYYTIDPVPQGHMDILQKALKNHTFTEKNHRTILQNIIHFYSSPKITPHRTHISPPEAPTNCYLAIGKKSYKKQIYPLRMMYALRNPSTKAPSKN